LGVHSHHHLGHPSVPGLASGETSSDLATIQGFICQLRTQHRHMAADVHVHALSTYLSHGTEGKMKLVQL
jgi:hypothetical protein